MGTHDLIHDNLTGMLAEFLTRQTPIVYPVALTGGKVLAAMNGGGECDVCGRWALGGRHYTAVDGAACESDHAPVVAGDATGIGAKVVYVGDVAAVASTREEFLRHLSVEDLCLIVDSALPPPKKWPTAAYAGGGIFDVLKRRTKKGWRDMEKTK